MKHSLIALAVAASLIPADAASALQAPPPPDGTAGGSIPKSVASLSASADAAPFVEALAKVSRELSGDVLPDNADARNVNAMTTIADTPQTRDLLKAATPLNMSGTISYNIANGAVSVAVARINNQTSNRTSGSLRLRLIASTSSASGAQSISGYKLFESVNFGPVGPNSYLAGSVSGPYLGNPPAGTYYMIVALLEYDSVDCTSTDRYCVVDSFTVNSQTFGSVTPPPPPPAPSPTPPAPPPPAPSPSPSPTPPAPPPSASVPNGAGYNTIIVSLNSYPYCYQYVLPSKASTLTSLGNTATYTGTTSCSSLGYSVYAGRWFLDTVSWVFDLTAAFARIDCDVGVAVQCNVGNPPASPPPAIGATPPPPAPAPSPAPSGVVEVTEYVVIAINKYFITGRSAEKSLLDAYPAVYRRTGARFSAYVASSVPPAGYENICRFYLPPAKGGSNTHFYGRPSDCNLVRNTGNPVFEYEGEDFAVAIPTNGTCPSTAPFPVYRSFNNRVVQNDGNHRYTNVSSRYSLMASKGWISEGVVFCSTSALDGTE